MIPNCLSVRDLRYFSAALPLLLAALFCPGTALGQVPDLTAGEARTSSTSTWTINLGPTGLRGWVYHERQGGGVDTSQSRQIEILEVDPSSPADGTFAVDDVILGADGTGAEPVLFTGDARKEFAYAIAEAEAHELAILEVLRWRDGTTTTETLTLQHMGAYSATAPYDCPKSALILQQGLQAILSSGESSGRFSFGALSLLAANDPNDPDNATRMARARSQVRSLVPDEATRVQMMSDQRDDNSMIAWERGHTLIVLAEYYLLTGDTDVLPGIEAYAVNIAKNHSLFGSTGHIYAEKQLDGSANGSLRGVYGAVNSAGLPTFMGLLLARECGIDDPTIEPAIQRSSGFFAYYAGKGAIPYGEHKPEWHGHESNGKSGLAALAFMLEDGRADAAKFYGQMATAATSEREVGHTGPYFNYLWAPMGAASAGEAAAAAHFSRISWMLDLNRRWDHGFDYDNLNGEGLSYQRHYNDFPMSAAALLTYALPLRQLHMTGRGHDPADWLSTAEVSEAAAADGYSPEGRSDAELLQDLGSWSMRVQHAAGTELATRPLDNDRLNQLTGWANDPAGASRVGACIALGKSQDAASANARAATLAALLVDPDAHIRLIAAEAMRYLPHAAQLSQLDAVLAAAATQARDLFPIEDSDPMQLAHGGIATLLFYSGSIGPRGMIWDDLTGVDRDLLYPAIRAIALTPTGQGRSSLYQAYHNLSAADVDALADVIVDSVHYRAPADKMFSAGVRLGGIEVLQKHDIAEGVPLSMIFMVDDIRTNAYQSGLAVLEAYAGGVTTVRPDPDVMGFCQDLLSTGHAASAQRVLDAIAADPDPVALRPFKEIQTLTADPSAINLPLNTTTLQASAIDLAQGESVYTWRKVHGAGSVTFTPNGTTGSDTTLVEFDDVPGTYRFEVTMSDPRNFTEVASSIEVELRNEDGSLPANLPPVAEAQRVDATPGDTNPITLTATDPEGLPLIYSIQSHPASGTLTGTPPQIFYSFAPDSTGADAFTFQVMDSEGQVDSATVEISVASDEPLVYEPFDYPGSNNNIDRENAGVGFADEWSTRDVGSNEYETGRTQFSYGAGTTVNATGGLEFPDLPTLGSALTRSAPSGQREAKRTLSAEAISALTADNTTTWFSLLVSAPRDNAYATFVFGFGSFYMENNDAESGTFINNSRSAFGVTLRGTSSQEPESGSGSINAIAFDGQYPTVAIGSYQPLLQTGATHRDTTLVVGKINWKPNGQADELFLFRVEDLATGEPDESTAIASVQADMNQTGADSPLPGWRELILWDRGAAIFDEIRMGDSYQAVVPGSGGSIDPYLEWATRHGLSGQDAAPDAAPAGDGVANLLKFAFDMDPLVSASGGVQFDSAELIAPGMPTLDLVPAPGDSGDFRAVFARRKDFAEAQLDYSVHFSADLQFWWVSPAAPMLWHDGGDHEVDLMYLPFPASIDTANGAETPTFFRVAIEAVE